MKRATPKIPPGTPGRGFSGIFSDRNEIISLNKEDIHKPTKVEICTAHVTDTVYRVRRADHSLNTDVTHVVGYLAAIPRALRQHYRASQESV